MPNTTLSTFIEMMEQFISELVETFPNEKKLKSYKLKFETLKSTNPRSILEMFINEMSPFISYVNAKDESFILEEKSEIIQKLQLKKLWQSEEMTENTKDAIWAHLNTLYIFGSTINNIPENLINGIEELTNQYMNNMSEEDCKNLQNINPDMLMQSLQGLLPKN